MNDLEQHFGLMTVAQLAHVTGTSIATLVTLATGATKIEDEPPPAEPKPKSETTERVYDTRTEAGRDELDTEIFAYIDRTATKDEPIPARQIREAIGGTPAQIRTRLNSLIAMKAVLFTGKAAGTRYWI